MTTNQSNTRLARTRKWLTEDGPLTWRARAFWYPLMAVVGVFWHQIGSGRPLWKDIALALGFMLIVDIASRVRATNSRK